ncbi:MAG: phosphomevalonate kinase, partial [Candidatus Aenigmarchaeota archaeon]|nr:phosphomevalonate kinase [Candidatus Aenigmarchaeota archaeon]
ASTYGGIFVYKRFDADWLNEKMKKGSVRAIARQKWPGFLVEELKISRDFIMLVAWTKESASTSAMIKQMNIFKESDPEEYKRLYDSIAALVRQFIVAWKKEDRKNILELLRKNEELLRELGKKSGVNIETEELKILSNLASKAGAAGKLSGAGGGDCGIAICFDKKIAEKINQLWKEAGLYIVDATIDRYGVKAE